MTGLGFTNLPAASNSMNAAIRPLITHPVQIRPVEIPLADVASHSAPVADCISSSVGSLTEPFRLLIDVGVPSPTRAYGGIQSTHYYQCQPQAALVSW